MQSEYTPYVLPLLLVGALSIVLAVYAWKRRLAPGAMALMFHLLDLAPVARRNAQIFETQRHLIGRQTALYETLRTITPQTNPDQIALMATEAITRFTRWPDVFIALPEPDKKHWRVSVASGDFAGLIGRTALMNQTVIGFVFTTGQSQTIVEPGAVTGPDFVVNSTGGSLIVLPLQRGEHMLGVLGLASEQSTPFKADDMLLAESLAETVALTLDNARLYAETQQRLTYQTALRQASHTLSSTLDLPTVLNHLAEQLGQAADVTSACICNLERNTMTASVLATYFGPQATPAEKALDLNTTYQLSAPSSAHLIHCLNRGEPCIYHFENPYLPAEQRTWMMPSQIKTTLIIPLQIRGETIAYAELHESRQRRDFTPAEIALGQDMAQQAAIAIENARFYDEAQQQAVGLSALYTVTRMVSQSLELEDILSKALSAILISLGFDAGIISLADPVSKELKVVAEKGLPPILSKHFQKNAAQDTLCQYIYTQREIVALYNLQQEAPIDVSELAALGFQSYVGLPLIHRQESLGTISLFTRQPRRLSPDDLALLNTISNQIAVSVSNAELFRTMADQRTRLQALIESSRDGVLLVGMDRRVLVTNAQALKFLNLSGMPAAWQSQSIPKILGPMRHDAPAVVRATLAEMRRIKCGDEPVAEGEFQLSSRTIHWLNLPVLTGQTPIGRLIVLRDVTTERMLEKMRENLTHTMVHDLRNPLSAIYSALELMRQNSNNLTPDQSWMLDIARSRTEGMLKMVSDILDVSRLESGRMPLNRTPIALNDLIHETLQAQSPLAADKNLHLETGMPEGLPSIYADANLIERVLQNLIGNAIKFTPDGGLIKITTSPVDKKDAPADNGHTRYLKVSVTDSGPGLPPKVQSHLFEKFVTGEHEKSGSGLGLAFCKQAVEAHGGRIWAESEPGEGTTFNFTLPITPRNPKP